MGNKFRNSLTILFLSVSTPISADIHLTPWVGYTGGGKVVAQNEKIYDLQGSESYAITGEIDLDKGRVGFFYSNQNTNVDSINLDSTMHYLQLQRALLPKSVEPFSSPAI